MINEDIIARNQIWSLVLGEDPAVAVARSIESPAEMNYADYIVVDSYLFTTMNLFYLKYKLANEGIFEESEWQQTVDRFAPWFLGSTFGRAWWHGSGRHFFAAEFSDYVDKVVKGSPEEDSIAHWNRIRVLVGDD